jgi:hypothetical protein
MPPKPSSNRRIFIDKDSTFYQILSFTQHADGSIYCSIPEFKSAKWMSFGKSASNDMPVMITADSPQEMGKFSMHGSGMLTFRSHSDTKGHTLIIKGHPLIDTENGSFGVRHVFTYFPTEPKHLPNSPAFNRESDYVLKKQGQLKPFVMVFFAVPYKPGLKANINISFNVDDIDDLETTPPDVAFGTFGLRFHNLVWVYYRTKHMDRWPQSTHICYFDGFLVPILIITGEGTFRLELRKPSHALNGNDLTLTM